MKALAISTALVAIFGLTLTAFAEDGTAPGDQPTGSLSLLKPGNDYVIRFTEGSEIFKTSKSGVSETSYTTSDGETKKGSPATWTMTLKVTMFEVVRVGGGSWVLVRHPTNPDDYAKWEGQRRAKAILAGPSRDKLAAEEKGAEQLARLQEAADREIKTTETWLNLNHAVAITNVPSEPIELKFNITSAEVKK